MPGIGIGLGLGLGGSGALTEVIVVRAISAGGLTDAQARAAIGGAVSLPAGLRLVGLIPASVSPVPAPTVPAVTPLPTGVAAMRDAASLSALADGASVTTWTDGVGGSVATPTSDSTTPHTYVRDSGGGLPAVRLSGAAVLATTGTDAASTAMTGAERGIIVVRVISSRRRATPVSSRRGLAPTRCCKPRPPRPGATALCTTAAMPGCGRSGCPCPAPRLCP